jgi:hypothetical protein
LHLDHKLTWRNHIEQKKKQVDLKAKEINWLLGRKSHISIENRLIIYKAVLKPVWMYGCELWGCASKTNIHIIQRLQSRILRGIADAPWSISNLTLHTDCKIPFVQEAIQEGMRRHRSRTEAHSNSLMAPLLQAHSNRRLKRAWPTDV